ncbi:26 kDa periplasmic immunogenic protein precursor [Ruminiclostridium hungatei]|uniref:26 kDa periplasmic immunogenic protein n=1 Tax=Ruminiclostridium hungatei TaxID=48256 RepID=A0A1V4SI26_RUMHU|nr:SIMPL domain-containing protein [Ruminiclostridium hungatei]OPX42891.1 26 kDa periplasmic immunogenic protein precursor [Ruminiclostridium hungatei]
MNFIARKPRVGMLLLSVLLVISVLTTICFAEGNTTAAGGREEAGTISVTGTADVMVMPDEAVFSLAVETTNLEISKAKSENDTRIKKIKAITNELKIESKYVVTDYINVNPKYTYSNNGESIFKGYTVHRGLVITLKDLAKFEELLTSLLEAGANYIQNVQFKTTQLRKYKDEARTLAIRAAKEKASAMAKELGQTVGKASLIQEVQEDAISYYSPWSSAYSSANWAANSISNATSNVQMPAAQGSSDDDFSPGQIKVSARVSVTFNLN